MEAMLLCRSAKLLLLFQLLLNLLKVRPVVYVNIAPTPKKSQIIQILESRESDVGLRR